MKIGFYNDFRPCVLKDNGVVDISQEVQQLQGGSPQLTLENIIVNFQFPEAQAGEAGGAGRDNPVERRETAAARPAAGQGALRPGQLHGGHPRRAGASAGDLLQVARRGHWAGGHHRASILPAGHLPPRGGTGLCDRKGGLQRAGGAGPGPHLFGYTTSVDVSARAPVEGEATLPGEYGKSFDTFLPIGPAITTTDEISDPNNLNVKYRVNGDLRQDYNTGDMEHSVAYLIAALSANMTLKPGDLIPVRHQSPGSGPAPGRRRG